MVVLPDGGYRRARAAITAWPGYAPTPLLDLAPIAADAGVARIRLKDEAGRFGLGSFKALGGAYAVANLLEVEHARSGAMPASLTVTCATDGNHGRSVAWGVPGYVTHKRDATRMAGHPLGGDSRYHRGHLMSHGTGGG
ncbi:MAG TPA: pyridoxal-phosphate dependent enzyme, partial [Acetobacteraceae bacterium]|nr:pyridoxal-phosphate dependent enzyme [Acetobacteraceae bacterium]